MGPLTGREGRKEVYEAHAWMNPDMAKAISTEIIRVDKARGGRLNALIR
jgi:hypothetical protein